MELANALEAPLLGAHPETPDLGLVKYYTLASDLREYARFDSGNIQYRHPRYHNWLGYFNGASADSQWLRNTDGTPQSRRTNFLCPYNTARLAQVTMSSRDDLSAGSVFLIQILSDDIDGVGDIVEADTLVAQILSTDAGVTLYRNGKRFFVDLRSLNIEVSNTRRYGIKIDNIGNFTQYRDPMVKIEIEERFVQP